MVKVEAHTRRNFLLEAKNGSGSCDFITALVLLCKGEAGRRRRVQSQSQAAVQPGAVAAV